MAREDSVRCLRCLLYALNLLFWVSAGLRALGSQPQARFGVSLAGRGSGHLWYLHGCGKGRTFRSLLPSSPPRLRSIPDPAQTPSSHRCPSAGLPPAHLGDRILAARRGLRWFMVCAGCFRRLGQCWDRAEFMLN